VPNDNPEIKFQLPDTPNVEWQEIQFNFTGQWLPDLEAALIGPENFAELLNLRYNDVSIEGVSGYTKYNTTALDASSSVSKFDDIKTGIQLRTNRTTKSHVLTYSKNARNTGRIYQNTTAVDGTQGNFDSSSLLDVNGNTYFEDSETGLNGRFSLAPQNSICFCNSKQTQIFSGFEHSLGAAFGTTDDVGTNIIDRTTEMNDAAVDTRPLKICAELISNTDFESGVVGWANSDIGAPTGFSQDTTQVYAGDYAMKVDCSGSGANTGVMASGISVTDTETYRLTFWVYSSQTSVKTQIKDGDGATDMSSGGALTAHTIIANEWNQVTLTANSDITGAGAEVHILASAADTFYVDNVSFHTDGYSPNIIMMTTRPVQNFKFYVDTANADAGSAATLYYWNGSGWTDAAETDNTDAGNNTLEQTGTMTFTHTYGNAELKHFQELYLYTYKLNISNNSGISKATLKQITCDPAMQPLANVWDGVYRQPIQFQAKKAGDWNDWTLHVNQSSDLSVAVGAELEGLVSTTSDEIIILFEEQMAGIRLKMWGEYVNSAAATFKMYYWDGNDWSELTSANSNFIDGTLSTDKASSFGRTGLIEWTAQSDEEPQSLFGSYGYAYKLELQGGVALASTHTDNNVTVDTCTGIPANIKDLKNFDFSVEFKDRLMLGSFSDGEEGNRMDYSSISTPDVWNGFQSSDYGWQSLRFGGTEKITCATQLFNRFGASIFAMLLVFKNTELYILTGDTPSDFQIFPVSRTVGCPAPYTLATAEVGLEVGEGLTRNIACWISHSGPMMFDGAVLLPIQGIDHYFDPNDEEFIEWDKLIDAKGWIDPVYKEYNVLLPSGQGEVKNNAWLVYDLRRKKWFRKHPGTRRYPQCAFNVMHTTGQQQVIGGFSDGFCQYLEYGTTWDGEGITQRVRTGDFWPTNNIWDQALVRKFKLYAKKIQESDRNLSIYFYADTNADSGVEYNFTDSDDTDMAFTDSNETDMAWAAATTSNATLALDDATLGLQKITRIIKDTNRIGWAHSVACEVTTTTTKKGFQPISWGMRYRVERKDDTAT
jgi:hypothetical protein